MSVLTKIKEVDLQALFSWLCHGREGEEGVLSLQILTSCLDQIEIEEAVDPRVVYVGLGCGNLRYTRT